MDMSLLHVLSGQADFMTDNIRPIFQSVDQGPLAAFVKEAWYFTPMAGCFHLLALSLLGAAIVTSDLRVIGPGVTARTPAELNRTMHPYLLVALVVLIFSGILLGLGEVMRIYDSPPFWIKMASLFSAIVFTFTTRDSVIRNEGKFTPVAWAGLAVSMIVFLWSWNTLTDWFFGARQAYLIFTFFLVGMVVGPNIVPAGISGTFRSLPFFVKAPVLFIVFGAILYLAFALSGINYMTEADMNGMGIGAYFQPRILGMIIFSFAMGLIAWAGTGDETQPMSLRVVSALSIFLWMSVAIAGRWIAFW